MQREIVVLDAPSNLGLRPPEPDAVPGVYKLAGALRDAGVIPRLGARDGGTVTPPRYHQRWDGRTVRNRDAIAWYSARLADRVGAIVAAGRFPLVLGGDCSILLGSTLGLRALGRYGLVFLDGHLDFRQPGNAPAVGAAAGEDLALATGRGADELTNLRGRRPYVRDADVVAVGFRANDEHAAEVGALGIAAIAAQDVRRAGAAAVAEEALARLARRELGGFWIHLDADVLDARLMPAVDTPAPDGLTFEELDGLLATLLRSGAAAGLELTIFDPDLDPDGPLARRLADVLVGAVGGSERPD